MTSYYIFTGAYGSGKTEIALNTAVRYAGQGQSVTLVDLDIVNPYFRSSDHKAFLKKQGIRLISPLFAGTMVDIPALPAEMYSVFHSGCDRVIIDVGGDEAGAAALGRFHNALADVNKTVYMVINTRRPFCGSAEELFRIQKAIEKSGKISVDTYINNTNMAEATSPQDLAESEKIIDELSGLSQVNNRMTSGTKEILSHAGQTRFPAFEIVIHTRPDWLSI